MALRNLRVLEGPYLVDFEGDARASVHIIAKRRDWAIGGVPVEDEGPYRLHQSGDHVSVQGTVNMLVFGLRIRW